MKGLFKLFMREDGDALHVFTKQAESGTAAFQKALADYCEESGCHIGQVNLDAVFFVRDHNEMVRIDDVGLMDAEIESLSLSIPPSIKGDYLLSYHFNEGLFYYVAVIADSADAACDVLRNEIRQDFGVSTQFFIDHIEEMKEPFIHRFNFRDLPEQTDYEEEPLRMAM